MARARTLWEEGTEPGRRIVLLGVAVTLAAVALDLALTGGLGWLYDVAFVTSCVALALLVRPRDFFTVGVLPPLLMLGTFVVLALSAPERVAHPRDGAVQAVVTGLAGHSGALLVGYVLALACLATRQRVLGQLSKRPGSPAPRRTTVGAPSE
ncbi:DUF6542 domain-containing protein [Nocardioides donggukensis]|uniref:DUF6542 domain-containing protein n=1 Tax=Nocardioides donggukensis TaxID=2774019 RepID=A0A927Q097_9ACTN|nr:DUF6542 domain-containing protein [Nocardioides donggukensis]MBD8870360.1 hypothetical protein [Nocardioides donggukensis]